jgi:pyruvate dehydrogenase E1 component beta subunit
VADQTTAAWEGSKHGRARSAEIVSIVADEAFYDLDGPAVRITTPHIPLPAADILEDIALPTVDRIVDRVKRSMEG